MPITEPKIAPTTNNIRNVRHITQYGTIPHSFRLIHSFHPFGDCPFSLTTSSYGLMTRLVLSEVKLRDEWRDWGDPRSSVESNSGFRVASPSPPAPTMVEPDVVMDGGAVTAAAAVFGVFVVACATPVGVKASAAATLRAYASSGYRVYGGSCSVWPSGPMMSPASSPSAPTRRRY